MGGTISFVKDNTERSYYNDLQGFNTEEKIVGIRNEGTSEYNFGDKLRKWASNLTTSEKLLIAGIICGIVAGILIAIAMPHHDEVEFDPIRQRNIHVTSFTAPFSIGGLLGICSVTSLGLALFVKLNGLDKVKENSEGVEGS